MYEVSFVHWLFLVASWPMLKRFFYSALWNPAEVDLIVKLCRDLTTILHVDSVGIITPYRQQKGEIQCRLMDEWVWFLRVFACERVNQKKLVDCVILTFARRKTFYGSASRSLVFWQMTNNVALSSERRQLRSLAMLPLFTHYSVNSFEAFCFLRYYLTLFFKFQIVEQKSYR